MGVVLVMEHTGGRDLLFPDGPGSVEREVYASGKDWVAGGFEGAIMAGLCTGFPSGIVLHFGGFRIRPGRTSIGIAGDRSLSVL